MVSLWKIALHHRVILALHKMVILLEVCMMSGGQTIEVDEELTISDVAKLAANAHGKNVEGHQTLVILDMSSGSELKNTDTVNICGLANGHTLILLVQESRYTSNAGVIPCYLRADDGTFPVATPPHISDRFLLLQRVDAEEYPWTVEGSVVMQLGKFTVVPGQDGAESAAPCGQFYAPIQSVKKVTSTLRQEIALTCEAMGRPDPFA